MLEKTRFKHEGLATRVILRTEIAKTMALVRR